jgi:cytochrome c biogenesis protein CcdA
MELTWPAVILLALADSVNPCALAVLFMILMSIMIYNPNKKSKVLIGGLSFVFAVLIMYLIYGAIIITLFTGVTVFLKSASYYVYKGFGVLAILLGLLGIKDYIAYRPGTIGTEMPLMLRPKVKKIISKVTSIKGAFATGIFVSLFLLPCTIGPYLVFGSLIGQEVNVSQKLISIVELSPYIILYNFIFILPMLMVTLFIYYGLTTIKDAQEWKERNIKILHLIAGVILLGLGFAMVFGVL